MLLRIKKKAAKKAPYEVRIALTKQEVRAAVAECLAHDVVGLDTETTGCNPLKESPCIIAKAFSVQIAYKNIAYFIPTFHIDGVCDFRDLVDELAPLWKKASKKIVAHNYKYDAHVMENAGLRPHSKSLLGDTQVMSFTHNSGQQFHGLKECVKRWFKEDTVEFKPTFRVPKLKKNGEPGKAFRDVDFYEAISNPPKYVKELYLERVLPFREKLSGGQEAAKKLWLACGKKISRTAAELIISYASLDPIYTVKLYELLKEKLLAIKWANGKSLFHYFELIEVPYTMTLYRVERRGIRISKEKLLIAEKKCEADIIRTMAEFNRLCVKAGASTERMAKFNPKSGKDIAWLFKEVLGVKAKTKRRANGSESESWDDKTMEALLLNKKARPIVLMLQEYRVAVKILGTYIKPFLHQYATYKGFLHTTLKQAATRTARLSSSNPNLQNAPKDSNDPYALRKCFVASEDENSYLVMGDIDLAQVEARMCAHITQDPSLLKAVRAGWDLHALTATKAFSTVREFVGAQEITAELLAEVKKKFPLERDRAKVVFFGALYGQGAPAFAAMFGVSVHEAQEFLDNFFNGYSGIKAAMKKIQLSAREKGYIRTYLRRYCYVPESQSHVRGIQLSGDRKAYNYCLQGSAGDMVKCTMILCEQDERLKRMRVRMRLPIHDELIFTLPKYYRKAAKPIIEDYMSRPFENWGFKPLTVDTPADIAYGKDWAEAKG